MSKVAASRLRRLSVVIAVVLAIGGAWQERSRQVFVANTLRTTGLDMCIDNINKTVTYKECVDKTHAMHSARIVISPARRKEILFSAFGPAILFLMGFYTLWGISRWVIGPAKDGADVDTALICGGQR